MLLLHERAVQFKKLHNEWFHNRHFWFDKKLENDRYLTDKYFHDIKDVFEVDIDYLKQQDKEVQIGAIIAYDQLPRHFCRISNISDVSYSNIFSKIAAQISITFMSEVYGKTNEYNDITVAEWCFILLPFRHLKDNIKIQNSIDFMISKHNNPYISVEDKNFCKRFITNSIKDIHESNTAYVINKYKNQFEMCNNFENQWNNFKDILENNPQNLIIQENNLNTDIVKTFKKETNKIIKTNDNIRIIVSLSGGVDSNVCLYMLKQYYPNIEIVAVFINYNNRAESDMEVKFVKRYCAVMGIKLFHRTITEISRKDCHLYGIRDLYETVTREIRFNTYKQVSQLDSDKTNIVMMGHNKDDCFENIITNIIAKHNYENLCGTEKMSEIEGIIFWRPLLDIKKKNIVDFAIKSNIPFLHDSTPKWSARGKIRDNVVGSLLSINEDAINSYFNLRDHLSENNNLITSYILPNIMKKFENKTNDIIIGTFQEYELLANHSIWGKVFENDKFRTFFEKRVISFKSIQQFVEYVERFKNKFEKMEQDNIFNYKTKFVLKNDVFVNIYRTRENMICLSFHKSDKSNENEMR